MSFKDKYEYIQGEYTDVSREQMSPSGTEAAWMIDTNGIKIAGYQIVLWSADTGGTQLIEGTDYSLTFQDTEKTSVEGVDIWAGYIILNPAYQVIPLYMDIRMIGGYTKLIPDSGVIEVPSSPGVVKDWLNVFDGPPAITVFNNWGEGRFHVTVGYEYKGDYYESDTDIDITDITVNKYEILAVDLQGSDSIISIGFRGETTGEFEVLKKGSDFTLYTIIKIDLWSDMGTGYVVPIQDGWVNVYDDPANTSPVPVADITGWGSGEYGVELINSAGDARYSTSMRIESLNTDTYSADVGTSTPARVIYDQAAGTLSCEDSTLYIIKIYKFIGLMNVRYSPAQEDFPPFDFTDKGAPLENGELIGDGSLSLISSSGRIPMEGNVEIIPGKSNIDGVSYYDDQLKWQGRGVYGVFSEYSNVAGGALEANNADIEKEGQWTRISATSATAGAFGKATFGALSNKGILSAFVKKGNTSITNVDIGVGKGSIEISWGDPTTISFLNGATDSGSVIISNSIVLVRALLESSGGTILYLNAGASGNVPVGSHSYYLEWQISDFNYIVPYTPNNHSYNLWQYSMDWALSTEWTIEGWFYNTGDLSHTGYINIFHTAIGAVQNRWTLYFAPGERVFRLYSMTDSGGGGLVIGSPPVGWNHVKLLWESGTRFRASLNGGAYTEMTSNVLTTDDCHKIVTLGSFGDDSGYLNSYLADWAAHGGIDDSHDHYLKGEPYYDQGKQYGNDALWSIDSMGHITGNKSSTATVSIAELPVGFVYTQYPGKQSPVDLAFPGTWANITAEFADNFFRAEGPKTAPFDGSVQEDQMQQITARISIKEGTGGIWNESTAEGAFGTDLSRSNFINGDMGGDSAGGLTFDSSNSPNARTGDETRPINQTIRIWERTA